MTPERWKEIARLYAAAAELSAERRAAFLREACGDDDALRTEVESLLANGMAAGEFLNAGAMFDAANVLADDSVDPLVGRSLGHYAVISLLGVGGMGEVYKARDARLGRDVALKVLPALASQSDSARSRFMREAKAVAALSHPNIRSLYDVGEADGRVYAVMELLEGETLRARLKRGPLSLRKATEMSAAIAEGVAAAHTRGIVHRDLKPENVFITAGGHVKVLDFGLAKMPDPVGPHASTQTATGTILGTPGYMSPEQVSAGDVDARSDIFALGCVLHEMVSCRRPFERKTATETMTAILSEDPPELEAASRDLRRIVAHCLEKQPDARFQSAQDLAFQLRGLISSADTAGPTRAFDRRFLWPGVALLLLSTTVVLSLVYFRQPASPGRQVRFDIAPPAHTTFFQGAFALSPDGTRLAFVVESDDTPPRVRLGIHSLDSGEAQLLSGAGDAVGIGPPVWSPDGRFIAFAPGGAFKKIAVTGGSPQTVVEASTWPAQPGTWSKDDIILFLRNQVLMKVQAAGGAATALTALDPGRSEIMHLSPWFLPDGRHFLYVRLSSAEGMTGVFVGSVDARPEQQSTERLVAMRGRVRYAPSRDDPRIGHVLFNRDGTLWAQGFDAGRLTLTGEPVPVAEQVGEGVGQLRPGFFSVSGTGALAYRRRQAIGAGLPIWLDPSGRTATLLLETPLTRPEQLRLSPDGHRLAVIVEGDLWVYDLGGRPPIKLTSEGGADMPLWTPDGKRIVYARNIQPFHLLSVPSDTAGATPERVSPNGHYHPHGWSPDGRELIAVLNTYSSTHWDILGLPLHEKREPTAIAQTPANESGAALSPDGRWLAYSSDATGETEVWVQPYPGPGASKRVSPHGGVDPKWARDGHTLYYLEQRKLMAVAVETGSAFDFKPAAFLFEMPELATQFPDQSYDVAPDGRFIMIKAVSTRTAPPITVILNWTAGLTK